jgi:hypothetical protein
MQEGGYGWVQPGQHRRDSSPRLAMPCGVCYSVPVWTSSECVFVYPIPSTILPPVSPFLFTCGSPLDVTPVVTDLLR